MESKKAAPLLMYDWFIEDPDKKDVEVWGILAHAPAYYRKQIIAAPEGEAAKLIKSITKEIKDIRKKMEKAKQSTSPKQ